jgi:hypothetical protein
MLPIQTDPSQAVVEAVADHRGVAVEELRDPLYDVVDPDALDDLFRDGTGRVAFEYLGYDVTVRHDGTVDVFPAEDC